MHVLDLGAGSLKVIGKYFQRTRILRADGDALAPGHDQLLEKYSFISLVRTIFGIAEDVATQLSHGVFDLAHACKSLDLGGQPASQELSVVKSGGCVYFQYDASECLNEHWRRLHRRNFPLSGSGGFITSSRSHELNVTKEFVQKADVGCKLNLKSANCGDT